MGKQSSWRKTCPCDILSIKSCMDWPRIEPGPPWWWKQTNHLDHGMALFSFVNQHQNARQKHGNIFAWSLKTLWEHGKVKRRDSIWEMFATFQYRIVCLCNCYVKLDKLKYSKTINYNFFCCLIHSKTSSLFLVEEHRSRDHFWMFFDTWMGIRNTLKMVVKWNYPTPLLRTETGHSVPRLWHFVPEDSNFI